MFGVPGFSKDDVPFKDSIEEGGLPEHVLVLLRDKFLDLLSVCSSPTKQANLPAWKHKVPIYKHRKLTHSSVPKMLLVTASP